MLGLFLIANSNTKYYCLIFLKYKVDLFRDSGSFRLFCLVFLGIIYGQNEFHKLCEYKRIKVVVHVSCEMLIDSDTFSHGCTIASLMEEKLYMSFTIEAFFQMKVNFASEFRILSSLWYNWHLHLA